MNKSEVIISLLNHGDQHQAKKMAKYMKNNFDFLGVPTPKRKEITKEFLKRSKAFPIDFDFINECFMKNYREYQYLGIDYLAVHQEELSINDIELLKQLILTKSWWDSVDAINSIVGYLVYKYPTLKNDMINWSKEDNIWLRRIAINHQLKYKYLTDATLLETIIINNLDSKEFFINKAIGWALREYSKTNPVFVNDFIESHKSSLSNLSIKEASKYL